MIIINVIGIGYIGLPTALMFARNKNIKVIGTDLNKGLIQDLNKGILSFHENGLENIFKEAQNNEIEFVEDFKCADVYIVAVPTPYKRETKQIDPAFLITAIKSIMGVCNKGAIIVVESTISPGTIDKFVRPIIKESNYKINEDIHIAHAPERIIPGNMVYELINNDRIIGVDNEEIGEKLKHLYSSFSKGQIILTNILTAEMTKVVENTFRDVNIALANELAKICHESGLDVYEIIRIANMHPRVNILQPGPGVGGHCISVDPWFLVGDYPKIVNVIESARAVNDSMPDYVLDRILDIMKENNIQDISKVGLYGLTYKENVNDTRESPTLQLLESTAKRTSSKLKVYDPYVENNICINQYKDFDLFLTDIELLVVMVAHDHIKNNQNKLCNMIILDTRNIFTGNKVYKL